MVENNDNIQQRDEDKNEWCRRYNKRKQTRMYALGRGFQREKVEREARNWKEERGDGKNPTTRWKMQRERARWNRLKKNGWKVLNGNKQGDEEAK
jgi:hypothetical protein